MFQKARKHMPPALVEFVDASWRTDHEDPRGLHDMQLIEFNVSEKKPGSGPVSISLMLLGSYHDRRLELCYEQVTFYRFGMGQDELLKSRLVLPTDLQPSHGDVLEDEVSVRVDGTFAHTLEFSSGGVLQVRFRGDFQFVWHNGVA